MDVTNSVNSVLTIVANVIIIFLGAVPLWLLGRENKLWWVRLSPRASKRFTDAAPSDHRFLTELYQKHKSDGSTVLTEHVILFRYNGSKPLDKSCIIRPITLTAAGTNILFAWKIPSEQDFDLEISFSRSRVRLTWDLLNPGWAFVVGVLCDGPESNPWRVKGLIKHISRIKVMSNKWMMKLVPLIVVLAVFPSVVLGDILWDWLPPELMTSSSGVSGSSCQL